MQRFLQVYEHDGEAPLHPEDLPEMLRVRAIPDLAGCFVSSGIEMVLKKVLVASYSNIPKEVVYHILN